MMKFKIVEDLPTGDFVFDAFGESIEELFVNCAEACFTAITDLSKIKPAVKFKIKTEADNYDDLLFNFLSELIYLKDVNSVFLSSFEIKIENNILNAVVKGELIDYNKHTIKTDVKAVTYYGLKISSKNDIFTVRVILDL